MIKKEWIKLTRFLDSDRMGKKQIGSFTFFNASPLLVKLNTPSLMLVDIKIQTKKPTVIEGNISLSGNCHRMLQSTPIPIDPKPRVTTSHNGPSTLLRYLACMSACDIYTTAGRSLIPEIKSVLKLCTVHFQLMTILILLPS